MWVAGLVSLMMSLVMSAAVGGLMRQSEEVFQGEMNFSNSIGQVQYLLPGTHKVIPGGIGGVGGL